MTIPNQPPNENADPTRPSVSTSSLPLVNSGTSSSPFGHLPHRLPNLTQQPSYHSASSPPPLPPPPPPLQYHSNSPYSGYNGSNGRTTTPPPPPPPPPPPILNKTASAGLVTHTQGPPLPPPLLMMKNHPYMDHQYHSTQPLISPPPPLSLQQQQQHDSSTMGIYNNSSENSPTINGNNNNNNGNRPLNVSDALDYLDHVKKQFGNEPTIYNQFLDIMKDFKTQVIDTPGVIDRVSTLFKGHSDLISGFNTFLPPGYRIETLSDPHDPNRIIVTTPNGNITTSTTTTAEEFAASSAARAAAAAMRSTSPIGQQQPYYYPYSSSTQHALPSLPPPSSFTYNHHHSIKGNGLYSNKIIQPSTPPPPPPLVMQQQQTPAAIVPRSVSPQAPIPSPIPPPAVSERQPVEFNHAINYVNKIKNRFVNSPEVYKQFLEILQTYQKEQKPIEEVYTHVQYLFNGGAEDLLEEFKQFLPKDSSSLSPPSPPFSYHSGKKRPAMSSSQPPPSVAPKKKKVYQSKKTKMEAMLAQQQQQQAVEDYYGGRRELLHAFFDPSKPTVSAKEVDMFERVRNHIGTKPSYDEFLKSLNLYTQQIFDMDEFFDAVKQFFTGDKELFEEFKKMVNHEPKEHPIEKPSNVAEKPDLQLCKVIRSSPSYRLVPKDWQTQPCSGRDQLCWEVLNDAYVSHPTWASEDTGFVASKKNSNEEALHKTEEERYEYDLNIEANLNTIALLEPIALQISQMTPEEQDAMHLKPGLGGPTVSIYERIIKKVYDSERGSEIIDMLYERPATVIPVLLNRLKMKDTEWKKAQREWNKIWREIDDKNFYKSLDYQGNTFKVNDRKAITGRALVTDMDVKKKEVFKYADRDVFKDVDHLIFCYMNHPTSNGFAKGDKQKIRGFLDKFVPAFFQITAVEEDRNTTPATEELSEEREIASPPAAYKGGEKNKKDTVSPPPVVVKMEQDEEIDAVVILPELNGDNLFNGLSLFAPPLSTATKKSVYTFYCHSPYLCLFRLYQVLYERLFKMKVLDEQIQANPITLGRKLNQTAVELDLYSNRFEDIDLSNGYYNALLQVIQHFLEGELDQANFEENVRYIFGIDAYVILTIDKVIQSLIKQIQAVAADKKSIELMALFIKQSQNGDNGAYRSLAEDIVSDETLYKITFNQNKHEATIQVLDKEHVPTKQELYEEYLVNYSDWMHDTKGVDQSLLKPSFLNRTLVAAATVEKKPLAFAKPQLRYKIQETSYHLYYLVGSEDAYCRQACKTVMEEANSSSSSSRWHELIAQNVHLSVNATQVYN